jgi:HTH-type transcriptional regulator/antitoxin HigA
LIIMAEAKNTIGLSRDLIIHPGETLEEVINDRNMTQKELAIRTGMTEKHISTVIHGQKGISASFAKKLEYALGIEASFWMNLQANYDREILEFEELHNISAQEIDVTNNLKEVLECWSGYGWLKINTDPASLVIDLRKKLGISNLLDIPKINYNAAFRAQTKNVKVDPYVLFSWQRMCELLTKDIGVADHVDTEMLQTKILDIKHVMFLRGTQIQQELTNIFAECGIAFCVVPNFKGAPVQGFIKRTDNGSMILCMTLRQKYADIFWFSLFHEVAHILNGDTKNSFIDFNLVSDKTEAKADKMAGEFLIDSRAYRSFIKSGEYKTEQGINKFADSQNVRDFIVQGRLMNDGYLPWKPRHKYEWAK